MTEYVSIHPDNPQARQIQRVVEGVLAGGVMAYPTDSGYALACALGNKAAMECIRRIRQLDKHHNFTLTCRDLSELATYAPVNNSVFRFLKAYTPGPYTFILPASREVPRRLQHPKRKTIGLRVPDHPIALAILEALDQPLMNVTLIMPGDSLPIADAEDIEARLDGKIDWVVDAGFCGVEPTTVVDLTSGAPEVLRVGKGDISGFAAI